MKKSPTKKTIKKRHSNFVETGNITKPRKAFFFDENVTSQSYLQMFKESFWPLVESKGFANVILFMQDGGPPHWRCGGHLLVRRWLDEKLAKLLDWSVFLQYVVTFTLTRSQLLWILSVGFHQVKSLQGELGNDWRSRLENHSSLSRAHHRRNVPTCYNGIPTEAGEMPAKRRGTSSGQLLIKCFL